MFPVLSTDWGPRKTVIMHICLSCCFFCFFSPRAKIFSGYARKVKSLSEQFSLSGDDFVSGKGAVDPSFCHDKLYNLLISLVLPEALAGSCPRAWLIPRLWCICWYQACGVFALMSGCIGRDFWTLVPWNFYEWHCLSSVIFFLFSTGKLEGC